MNTGLKLWLFLSLVILAVLTSCRSNPAAPIAHSTAVILPLAVGNMWQYSETSFDTNGAVTLTSLDTMMIQTTSQFYGDTFYYIINNVMPNFPSSIGYANIMDGLWFHQEDGAMHSYLILAVPYPIPLNVYKSQNAPFISTIGLINVDTVINVPEGSFHTLKYERSYYPDPFGSRAFHDILYFSVNVGLVYSEDYTYTSDGRLYLTSKKSLINYTLN